MPYMLQDIKKKPLRDQLQIAVLPKDAMINGLLQGRIPSELSDLNEVEQSMISIYSSITKVSLQGRKIYVVNGALCYTIVNDVASIASKLPRLPSITSITILRHANGIKTKDYTYRPYYVKGALVWLKANNRLYSEIYYDWPIEYDWNDYTAMYNAPYLPLSGNDIIAIDESDDINLNKNDAVTNILGMWDLLSSE